MVELADWNEKRYFHICNVYEPILHHKNQEFWRYLGYLRENHLHNKCIMVDDFNTTMNSMEIHGRRRSWIFLVSNQKRYSHHGTLLTSSKEEGQNKRKNLRYIVVHLDYFFLNIFFMHKISIPLTKIFPSFISNHKPILLEFIIPKNMGPLPFKFLCSSNREDDVTLIIRQEWRIFVKGSPSYIQESKLRDIKNALKIWDKNKLYIAKERQTCQEALK